MARKRYSDGEEAPASPQVPEAPASAPNGPETVTLRLRQNNYVRGAFAEGGSLHIFSPEEAERRLRRTQLWDRV